jgi:hypothetical protein
VTQARFYPTPQLQGHYRISLEKTVIESDVKRSDKGLNLGFIVTLALGIGGLVLIAMGRSLDGLAVIFGEIATVAGIFAVTE